MLCHGSLSSAHVVKAALDEFSLLLGLHANHTKSNIFTSGVSPTINQQLINHFGYTPTTLRTLIFGRLKHHVLALGLEKTPPSSASCSLPHSALHW
ncbi:hypothetical protein Dsin_024570 [Dipteronia sinensis]|uniref:Uncharacterized protein n=1 Tax=Dipteronia sinensis TaxID=43782 RepID=A0AAE0DW10_9ROSI|nr:hypothetical protein Dsin_024570 [Dipteronia sinensis]